MLIATFSLVFWARGAEMSYQMRSPSGGGAKVKRKSAVAIFTRPNGSTRTIRMLLINVSAIRNVRSPRKTNNATQF